MTAPQTVIAFAGHERIAAGDLAKVTTEVARVIKKARHRSPILVFDAVTGDQVDLDFRGVGLDLDFRDPGLRDLDSDHPEQPKPRRRPAPHDETTGEESRGPGRPKLGVVAREVTLLPRHWHWLASQPGGASVALRKLVEHAMRANAGKDRIRASQNAAYRFMSVMAGNRPGFEEAARALFAGDAEKFNRLADAWPTDIQELAKKLAADALRGP
jgi:uncharacterized protein